MSKMKKLKEEEGKKYKDTNTHYDAPLTSTRQLRENLTSRGLAAGARDAVSWVCRVSARSELNTLLITFIF